MASQRAALEAAGMPRLVNMQRSVTDFNNSGISIHYVNDWGLKEALRELVQNAVDAMMSFMKTIDQNAKKIELIKGVKMHQHNHTNGVYRTFVFEWPQQQNLVLGKITYDPDTQQVILENPGTINKFNLLLGGSGASKQQQDPDIIGRFGEGMKLAALALLRPTQTPYEQYLATHTRRITIDTGGQKWLFKLQKDSNFDDEICLFYKMRNLTNREARSCVQGWTYTYIQGVTFEEWKNSYKDFILFCKPEETMEIPTIGDPTHKGSLLLSDGMKGRFFVKELHITDYGSYEYDAKDDEKTYQNFRAKAQSTYYGFNANEVKLNRDRKSIPDEWEKYERCSCIMANVLNNMQQNLNLHLDAGQLLNEMWTVIYLILRAGRYEVYKLSSWATKATCDRIWKEWVKDTRYFPNNENYDNKVQPMYTSHQVSCDNYLRNNSLETSFYRYKILNNYLCAILYNSNYYESWSTRFTNLINGCDDSVLNEQQTAIKTRLVQKLGRLDNTINAQRVCFKDAPLRKATSYYKDNKLYLAKELLANEDDLFLKCLQLLKIPSSRLLEFCNL